MQIQKIRGNESYDIRIDKFKANALFKIHTILL